ncbi:hypothetical protein HRR83_008582 [Exophiala dermatitidis]|uniref:Cytochrome P450 n=1 Tax=Exophiala dermatitidis TaxID=5970 RepID=A0AAN6EW67_EXODE|nr:hypothetical protein HRR73_008397 [Exophiala dermatitidis]KAJ4506053.1 hypothetical protein HRR74_008483 [Exophiala dermatitidis]KAJ4536569.1 hypothetical protein HRR76_004603 [Exophiala dermatitidis]KAJ4555825.1 hypothetical protein HRR77_001747 [Exophiala dermatitidis]KAJ4559423.1 hypothetical protein HRR79_008200 [Exophiala dermatitidis]
MKRIPLSFMKQMDLQAASLLIWQRMVRARVTDIIADNKVGKKSDGTIFQTLLDSDLPPHEKTVDRLQDEGQVLIGAGSETTAKALSIITFFLLEDKRKLERLRAELKAIPSKGDGRFSLTDLEQLPYLTAAINEGIRLMHGVTTRLPRVSPTEPLRYKDWIIPPGTPVSESNYFVHMDKTIFPNPAEYDPGRWLRAAEAGIRLDRYLVSFTKGSRMCVGINLAYAELYLTVAMIMSRFEMENYETSYETDIRIDRDFFVGVPSPESKGVRAKIVAQV